MGGFIFSISMTGFYLDWNGLVLSKLEKKNINSSKIGNEKFENETENSTNPENKQQHENVIFH